MQELRAMRTDNEKYLSSSFWLMVYDNYAFPREKLFQYLKNNEKPTSALRNLPTDKKKAFKFLYQRLKYVNSHLGCRLWFVFFNDLWESNHDDMKVLKGKEEQLDPE